MRVAFSGAHRTGKTTLIEAVAGRLAGYEAIEEPYYVLEERGVELSDPPTVEDFELQLRCSMELVAEAPSEALLDRCPLDFLAYLEAIDEGFELDEWLDEVRESVARLDLIVVVPIEAPDRIALPAHEDRRLRRRVDERLLALALEDAHGFGVETLEVAGTLEERVRQVMGAMKRA